MKCSRAVGTMSLGVSFTMCAFACLRLGFLWLGMLPVVLLISKLSVCCLPSGGSFHSVLEHCHASSCFSVYAKSDMNSDVPLCLGLSLHAIVSRHGPFFEK